MKSTGFHHVLVRFGARLEYVIPIVSSAELAALFGEVGYRIVQNPNNPELFVCNKGSTEVYLDGLRRVVGAQSESIDNSLKAFNEIFDLSKRAEVTDLRKHVSFYECEINAIYRPKEDVYSMMSRLYRDSQTLLEFNKILGGEFMQFNLKLTPSGKRFNRKEWHELTIEPKITEVNFFLIRMVCRSESIDKVINIAKKTEEHTTAIIEKAF